MQVDFNLRLIGPLSENKPFVPLESTLQDYVEASMHNVTVSQPQNCIKHVLQSCTVCAV